ncbi:MAG: HAD hydrolase family protein [Acidobacteria bacterium]|nr:HAD hydrolase family protein [Acidobacteriota bacterium]
MPPVVTPEVRERAARIKLVLMDVDGVLTDGKYFHVPNPAGGLFEVKLFDSQDGIALQWLHREGIKTGLISGRDAQATAERARTSHMAYCYMGHTEKLPLFNEILAESKLSPEEICYLGDDLTDAILMKRVGLAVAVANATPEVKRCAHYVTAAAGGQGALREAAELIFDAQGKWEGILRHYEIEP